MRARSGPWERSMSAQAEGDGPGRSRAGDDAVILPGQSGHAQASQFIHGRRCPLRMSGGVSDHQLEWSSADPAGLIDFVNGQLEASEQVPARLDPARPGERNQSADPDRFDSRHPFPREVAAPSVSESSAAKASVAM